MVYDTLHYCNPVTSQSAAEKLLAGKTVYYTGHCTGEQIQIILGEDDVASLCTIESAVATAEDLAKMGLTGNLIMSHVQRVELTASPI